jgi:hypothetical protein
MPLVLKFSPIGHPQVCVTRPRRFEPELPLFKSRRELENKMSFPAQLSIQRNPRTAYCFFMKQIATFPLQQMLRLREVMENLLPSSAQTPSKWWMHLCSQ